ncbi:PIG-L deacetylase family protein [Kineococcus rhizosphaerae]|nr:PIG-L family deacetylase [Kineococcus rhizosphaerae]
MYEELPGFDLDAVGPSRWVVLSPHLDDAVLSCGNLLLALAGRGWPATVATFFTECSAPLTLSAQAFLRQCGASSAPVLYEERRREDAEAVAACGARALHAGLPDALFRRFRSSVVPELAHVYPTWRFHLSRGVVSRRDPAVALVDRLLADLLAEPSDLPTVLVAPMGIGGHVDHVLVGQAAERARGRAGVRVVRYADVPYVLSSALPAGVRRFAGPGKAEVIGHYRNQVHALFPQGVPVGLPDLLAA